MAKGHHPSVPDMASPDVTKRSRTAGRGHGSTALFGTTGPHGIGNRSTVRSDGGGRMVEAVLQAAAGEGLTVAKDGRIAGRVSSELIARAKARTGLTSDTELLEFALASVAIEDGFAEAFHAVRGTIDPDGDLGF